MRLIVALPEGKPLLSTTLVGPADLMDAASHATASMLAAKDGLPGLVVVQLGVPPPVREEVPVEPVVCDPLDGLVLSTEGGAVLLWP